MKVSTVYPAGTRSDGGRLELGRIRQLTENSTIFHRNEPGSSQPPPPPAGTDPHRRGGDGDRPSRLEAIAMRLVRASNYLLLAALVCLLLARRRAR